MQKIERTVQHSWKLPEEYNPNSIDTSDKIEGDIDSLRGMQANQFYFIRGCTLERGKLDSNEIRVDLRDTTVFQKYIESLRDKGFDIGNNPDSQYGYEMPLPKKGETQRKLKIFRRY